MYYVTLGIFLLSGWVLLVGLFIPKKISWGKKKTRTKIVMTYLPIMIIALLGNVAVADEGLKGNIEKIEAEINQADKEYDKQAKKAEAEEEETSEELDGMQVDFIDVGQADAALLQYEEDDEEYNVLIDTGDWSGNETVEHLEAENVDSIDLIADSHEHADHIGQTDKVIDEFDVEEVWLPGNEADSEVYERVIDGVEENDIAYEEPRAGDEYEIGPLEIEVVSPQELTGDLNDDSLVLNVTYGDVSFLFTGDAEQNAESIMVDSDYDLSADVLKAGHHGSNTSTTEDFLREVDPDTAIISVGEDNSYDHPSEEIIERLDGYNIDTYLTKDDGTITIETDGVDYNVQ